MNGQTGGDTGSSSQAANRRASGNTDSPASQAIQRRRQIVSLYDTDGNGTLSKDELAAALTDLSETR